MKRPNTKLGQWASTSLVLGNMIGSGIFLLPASLAAYGGISLMGWFVSSIGALLLAKVFASLSGMVPLSGGPFTYTRAGMGDFAGFLVAWGYWLSILCTNAAITVAMLGYLGVFFPVLNESPLLSIAIGVSIIWLLTWINNRGIHHAGYVQLVTTVLKVIPLLLVTILGFLFFNFDHFKPFNLSGTSSIEAIVQTTTLTLFAFLGVECATIPSEQIEEPYRTIPKATWWGTLFSIVIYILGSISIMGLIPPETLQHSTAPFADGAEIILGTPGRYLIATGAVISTFGALNGWILMQGQIPMAASRDGIFPALFSKLNSNKSPSLGIVLSSVLVSLLLMTNYTKGLNKAFEFMILMSTLTVLVPYLFSSAAYIILNQQVAKHSTKNRFRLIGMGAFFFSLFAIVGSGKEVVFWGFILLMLGVPVYAFIKSKH